MKNRKALYSFTWSGGGYNQVHAINKKEAEKEIVRQFGKTGMCSLETVRDLKRLSVKQEEHYWRYFPIFD